jgi:hypothetical protein
VAKTYFVRRRPEWSGHPDNWMVLHGDPDESPMGLPLAECLSEDVARRFADSLNGAAKYAAEVLALREAAEATLEPFSNALSKLESQVGRNPDLPSAYRTILREGFEARDQLVSALSRPLPDAAKRLEAEARLGRAARAINDRLLLQDGGGPRQELFDEFDAALDALRALDGGDGE